MDITEKISEKISKKIKYNMGCYYIKNTDERCRYVKYRQMLFQMYNELYSVFQKEDDE